MYFRNCEMFYLIGNQYKAQSFGYWLIFMDGKSHWSGVLGQDEKYDGVYAEFYVIIQQTYTKFNYWYS